VSVELRISKLRVVPSIWDSDSSRMLVSTEIGFWKSVSQYNIGSQIRESGVRGFPVFGNRIQESD